MAELQETIVVGVPGPWVDRQSLTRALIEEGKEPKLLFAGGAIYETATKAIMGADLQGPDAGLAKAFEIAGQGTVPAGVLKQISEHASCAYLIETGRGLDVVRRVMRFASYLLDAGGFGVKVECSGIAHTADKWRYLARSPSTLSAYEAMVTLVGGREYSYSCGMHAFGLPDASVTSKIPLDRAPEILTAFNQRQLLKGPFRDREEFATAVNEPAFRIRKQPFGYDEDSLLNNPFGRWHMELAPARAALSPTFQTKGEPLFTAITKGDPRIQAAVAEARRTVPYFIAHFKSPYDYGFQMFKVRVQNGSHEAFLWVRLVDIKSNDTLIGEFFEAPPELGVKAGQEIHVPTQEIHDWAIRKCGTLIGGFSMRVVRDDLKPSEQRDWELFSGMTSFADPNEIVLPTS